MMDYSAITAIGNRLATNATTKGIMATLLSLFTIHIWDHLTPVYGVFFALYLIDFITGILNAMAHQEFSSKGLRRGLVKWIGYSLIVGVLLLLSGATANETTGTVWKWIVDWTLFYLMFGEYSSICENLEIFGVRLPSITRLSEWVSKIKESVK